MNKQPVICPWCGYTMDGLVKKYIDRKEMYYCCSNPHCHAQSPIVSFTDNSEYAAANQLSYEKSITRIPQKPLSNKQLLEHEHGYVFWETRDNIEACRVEFCNMGDLIEVYWIGTDESDVYDHKDYGRRWRCWNHYPTEEERNATPWKT